MHRLVSWSRCLVVLGAVCLLGCSSGISEPPLATVKGKVTVDGQPGVDLEVTFEPQVGGDTKDASKVGGGSTGRTDPAGNYELSYKGGATKGAVIGKHVVRITRVGGGGPAGGESAVAIAPIPEQFNVSSTLTADIVAGDNTKDFEITTQ